MNYKMIAYTLGKIMVVEALLLILPFAVSIYYKENNYLAFIIPIVLLALIGTLLSFKKSKNSKIYAREGFIICALAWVVMSVFGALPFTIGGYIPNYIDALFETISGFTTTGSSILQDIEVLPQSMLFWRSFTHWIGGMGVLVLMLAVLPNADSNSMHIMRAEVPGFKIGKLVSKITLTARILYAIYVVITILEIIFLLFGGMPLFDSIVNTFATAGTGGFSVLNSSIGGYNNAYAEYVISIFMIIFGINFNMFYFLLIRKFKSVFKNEELRLYLIIIAVSVAAVTWNIFSIYGNLSDSFRAALFQVSSIITTTGFSTQNFSTWPMFSQIILFFLMFCGACAGSTGGGIKISRIKIIFKQICADIRQMIRPRSVVAVKFEGKALDSVTLRGIRTFFFTYIIVCTLSIVLISLNGLDFTTTITSVAACINNIGPGLGDVVGPAGNYSSLSVLSKLVLSFDMLAGRLELFPILILFSPSTWRRA